MVAAPIGATAGWNHFLVIGSPLAQTYWIGHLIVDRILLRILGRNLARNVARNVDSTVWLPIH